MPHEVPLVTGVVPHVGGPIVGPGAPNVLIGGLPAARVGDMATCVGPPDTVLMGSFKVLIGGQPAARMGDMTAHGGTIVFGMPTVLIACDGYAYGGVTHDRMAVLRGLLDELPGVGPATAAAIIAHREQHGPFSSVDDLADVRGIGPAKVEALRGLVTT